MRKIIERITLVALLISIGLMLPVTSRTTLAALSQSELLEYEWPQYQMDPSATRFNPGPGPKAGDLLWRVDLPPPFVPSGTGYLSASNGKVYAQTLFTLYALDAFTGQILWTVTAPPGGQFGQHAAIKIDDDHLVVKTQYALDPFNPFSAEYLGFLCIDPDNGSIIWNFKDGLGGCRGWITTTVYVPELKMLYTTVGDNLNQSEAGTIGAWNFSDPDSPPSLLWTYTTDAGGQGIQYGDGKLFLGSFIPHQVCLDALTGLVLWDVECKGVPSYAGLYYDGKFMRGTLSNDFDCYDANSGELLWRFNPGTFAGFWSSGAAAAYGKVYQVNKDGHLYCIDVRTGMEVWKYKGPGMWYPGVPYIAEGKVYACTGQSGAVDWDTGEMNLIDEFACFDAETGQLLWKLPYTFGVQATTCCIAYGNLYGAEYGSPYSPKGVTPLLTIMAFGSSKPWPQFRHDSAHSGIGQSGPTDLSLKWKFAAEGGISSSPSVVDGKVYFGSYDKNLYCLDADTGSKLWNFTTDRRIYSSPAVVNGKVYTGPDDGYVYCLNADTGSELWKTDCGFIEQSYHSVGRFYSSPCIVDGKLYVGSTDGKGYCLNADSGSIEWTFDAGIRILSSPAVVEGMVYLASSNGTLYKLDATDGTMVWKTPMPHKQQAAVRGVNLMSSPTVADGRIFIGSSGNTPTPTWFCLNATTGTIIWYFNCSALVVGEYALDSALYVDGRVYFSNHFYLDCHNATSGATIWQTWLAFQGYSSPVYADGKIYQGRSSRAIYALDALTGEKLSYHETKGDVWCSPTLYEGKLYIGSLDHQMYCFKEASPEPTIICSAVVASLNDSKIDLSETVTVSGYIFPTMPSVSLKVTFIKPDDTTVDIPITATDMGDFETSYTPDAAGNWTVMAWYEGDEYHTYAYSDELPLEVVTTEPTNGNGNGPTNGNGAEGIPAEYIYVAVAVIVILIVAVAAYAFMKRRK